MAYGLTEDGFVLKRLPDIVAEIQTSLRTALGSGINLIADELLGQIVGIWSEREALQWEAMQAIYNSFSPSLASGVSLDNAVSITGIQRLEATKGTGVVTAYGTLATVIPAGSIVSVSGNPDSRFVTTSDNTIAAGVNEVQDIDFSAVPDAGEWTLIFDGVETGTLLFNDAAATVQTALNALSNLSAVTVSGNYTSGFTVTFAGADGSFDQPLLQIGTNTLENTSVAVNVNFAETTTGVLPNVDMEIEAETAGAIPAYADSITVIETPISGWDSVNNDADITIGTDTETDAELRLRREQTLATAGAATVDAIRSRLLEINEVTDARVFENDTDVTDVNGRPPHSIEAVVQDGDDQDIIDTIWDTKAAGIATYGGESGTAVDTMGFSHTVEFSRPTPVPIFIEVNIVSDPATFPVGGDDAIAQALADYGDETFSIGDDVLYHKFFCPIEDIEGVLEVELFIDIVDPAVGTSNITIDDDELATFDTANIVVNVT